MVNKKIQEEEQQLFQLYNRFPLVLDHGEGVYLYDTDGKKYLDFAAGIAVMSLGYQNKAHRADQKTVPYIQFVLS